MNHEYGTISSGGSYEYLRFGLTVCDLDSDPSANPNETITEYWTGSELVSGDEYILSFTATSDHIDGLKIGIYLYDYGGDTAGIRSVFVDDVIITDSNDKQIFINEVYFNSNTIKENDEIEMKYFIKS